MTNKEFWVDRDYSPPHIDPNFKPYADLAAAIQEYNIDQCKKYMLIISDARKHNEKVSIEWAMEVDRCRRWFYSDWCAELATATNVDGPYIWETLNKLYNKENYNYEGRIRIEQEIQRAEAAARIRKEQKSA